MKFNINLYDAYFNTFFPNFNCWIIVCVILCVSHAITETDVSNGATTNGEEILYHNMTLSDVIARLPRMKLLRLYYFETFLLEGYKKTVNERKFVSLQAGIVRKTKSINSFEKTVRRRKGWKQIFSRDGEWVTLQHRIKRATERLLDQSAAYLKSGLSSDKYLRNMLTMSKAMHVTFARIIALEKEIYSLETRLKEESLKTPPTVSWTLL